MPRTRSHTPDTLARAAMDVFWTQGYRATSLDDLVKATGVSRHGIYADFGGKRALFLESLKRYQMDVVTPAFARVEAPDATLSTIAAYFDHQILRAETAGLPGPGCLMANSLTEIAPHDVDIRQHVSDHNARLRRGFKQALDNEGVRLAPTHASIKLQGDTIEHLADSLVIFAQGLWSASRVTSEATSLRQTVNVFLDLISARMRL